MGSGVPNFTLDQNTVVGRLAQGVGPAEEIPLATLLSTISALGNDTSTTSNTIGTGSLTFTVSANKGFLVGQPVIIVSQANPANFVYGPVTSYSGTTLVMNSTATDGSGTFAAWNVFTSSVPGPTGATGATGAQGPSGSLPSAAATGTDTITATYSPALTLTDKISCSLVLAGANATSAPTFNPNGVGATTITKNGGKALLPGDLPGAGAVAILQYNATETFWELLNPALLSAGTRTRLTQAAAVYVSPTGNNTTGDGSAGNPWADPAYAYSYIQKNWDLAGQVVTCYLAGDYTGAAWNFNGPLVGALGPGDFVIRGTANDNTRTVTGAASVAIYNLNNGAKLSIAYQAITPGTSGFGVLIEWGTCYFGNMQFNLAGMACVDVAGPQSQATANGPITLGGGSIIEVFIAEDLGFITLAQAFTGAGTGAWSNAFVVADLGACIDGTNFTFSGGTYTGPRYNVTLNGMIFTGGSGGASFYPGNSAGASATGGQYV